MAWDKGDPTSAAYRRLDLARLSGIPPSAFYQVDQAADNLANIGQIGAPSPTTSFKTKIEDQNWGIASSDRPRCRERRQNRTP
jgi:hypothetical protein